jgi:hypothetical protein
MKGFSGAFFVITISTKPGLVVGKSIPLEIGLTVFQAELKVIQEASNFLQ